MDNKGNEVPAAEQSWGIDTLWPIKGWVRAEVLLGTYSATGGRGLFVAELLQRQVSASRDIGLIS